MIAATVIFVLTYLLIASEKVDRTIAALLGAAAVCLFHIAPFEELVHKVDLNVIFLLVGMMIIVNLLAVTGVFEWIAISVAQLCRGNGMLVVVGLLLVTAIVSAFLDNVTTVLLIAPVTILLAEILEISAVPILILEAIYSNFGGTATMVGDPPNIVIGSQTALTFNDFLINLTPVVAIVIVLTTPVLMLCLRRRMAVKGSVRETVMRAQPRLAIVEPAVLRRALPVFALVLIGFFVSHLCRWEPGIIALGGAMLMVWVCRQSLHAVVSQVEWSAILFFMGLFILIGALEINGVLDLVAKQLLAVSGGNFLLTVLMILWASAILSAIVDNIPLVIALIPMIKTLVPVFASRFGLEGDAAAVHTQVVEPLFWALALGACLGGNGSLIGASANIVIAQIAHRNHYRLSFWDFTSYGLPMMLASIVICSVYLYLRYFW